MKYFTPEFRARRMRAFHAAHALFAMADMRLGSRTDSLVRSFGDYIYLPESDLVIVPFAAEEMGIPAKAEAAARQSFSDAVLVTTGRTNEGTEIAVISVGVRKGDAVRWYNRLRPWMGVGCDAVWLVPIEPEDGAATFRLA